MCNVIMIGCDLHDATMVLRVAVGAESSVRKVFRTSARAEMIAWLREFSSAQQAERIVFAYEASSQGFGLYDDLKDAGIECHVLAPTHLPRTPHSRKSKTDDKDAEMILEEVRAHVLAGRKLVDVWVPDLQTRDDREPVRQRLQTAEERTRTKNQIRNLLKRCQVPVPEWFSGSGEWSRRSLAWLTAVELPEGARAALSSLVALYQALTKEVHQLDKAIRTLSNTPRYARQFRKLKLMAGVGTLTAMVFLTELGDLERFSNRRQLAAYLGLAPAANESGQRDDRKGHITRQGPARVRHLLCQAAWAALRCSPGWRQNYDRIKRNSKTRSKIAIVAIMRQLGIAMWQTARSRELDRSLDELDSLKTSAQAQRKGGRPSRVAVASAHGG